MNRKYMLVIIGVVLFLVLTNYMKGDPLIDEKVKENEQEKKEIEKEDTQELNLIDYYNLEGENRALQAQIDHKNQTIFELMKVIVSSETLETLPHYEFTEVIYKEVTDSEIILITKEDGSDDYWFSFSTKEQIRGNYILALDDEQKINWIADYGLYSGIIQDKAIEAVQVYKNEQSYETRFIELDESLRLWFTILDYEKKSIDEELDKMMIQALDGNGNVLWEESFENEYDIII